MDDDFQLDRPIDLTISSLDEDIDIVERDKQALEPVRESLAAAGFYAYTTYDDQQRWTVALDDEAGRVDVRVGMDGYHVEMWASSPGIFADEENEWKRRAQQRLVRIMLPMTRPAIAAVGLFQFFYCWNDYFGPQIYTSENPAAWTLSYGLGSFKSAHHTNWNLTMAATLLVMAPVIAVFFLAQKAFIEGVTLTGVKG